MVEALLEFAIALGFFVFALEFFERGHQRFGNVAAAVDAETAGGFGHLAEFCPCCFGLDGRVARRSLNRRGRHRQFASSIARTARIKARTFLMIFLARLRSTPEETSTPQGCSSGSPPAHCPDASRRRRSAC